VIGKLSQFRNICGKHFKIHKMDQSLESRIGGATNANQYGPNMSRGREIELKLELEPGSSEKLTNHALLRGGPAKATDQISTYFDTADGAIRQAGFSLRVREAKGKFIQTVKQSDGPAAGLFDRPEWEQEIDSADVNFDAADQTPLAPLLGKKIRKRLEPLIKVEVRRSLWNVHSAGCEIELILDEGVVTGGGDSETIAEVELELKQGEPGALIELARDLAKAAPLRLGVLTKAERGYRLADGSSGKILKAEPIELRADMNAADGFAAIAYACLRHFRLNEELVVTKRDPGALHQARVAMRRLRSAFTLFRPVISDDTYQRLREEVRWFTNQLGDARNLDVLMKRFGRDKGEEADRLRERLSTERDAAYEQVIDALRSDRLRALMIDIVGWIETGLWRETNEMARLPLPEYARTQLDKRWRKVRKGGKDLKAADPEVRHQLRIEVKKLRYAVEFLASLTRGDDALGRQKAFVAALEEMQEQLGELNDVETARNMLGNLLSSDQDGREIRFVRQRLSLPQSEGQQLEAAQKAYGQLAEVGRYWR
jgi:inorganic triphosphatase YgiF